MKKIIVGTILGLSTMVAFAQQAPMPPQQGQGSYQNSPINQQQRQERFQQRKQMILNRMQQRQEKLTQSISCVESAQSFDALKSCRPQRHKR